MSPQPDNRRSVVAWSFLALVAGSIPVFGTRFLNDTEFYALFADKLLAGGLLYRDAMDVKPPLVFLQYAVVFKAFGLNNMAAIKVLTMAILGVSALMMTAVRRALSPTANAPAIAGLLFILASFSGWGDDFLSSNTEIPANLFILVGVWVLVARDMSCRPLYLIVGGGCIAIASLYRYQSSVALFAYWATVLLRRRHFDRKIARVLLLAAGFVLPFAAVVLYYVRRGAIDDLRLLLAYQAHYVRDADDFYWPSVVGQILLALAGLWPVLLLATWRGATILRRWGAASRAEVFQLIFAAGSAATFFLGGHLYGHYFIQAIPPLVLLAAARLDTDGAVTETSRPRWRAWFTDHAVPTMAVVATVFTVINGVHFWTQAGETPRHNLVTFVEEHSRPDDHVLLWTWRPELLFQTNRTFATRQLVNGPLIGMPCRRRPGVRRNGVPGLWPAFLRDLADAPPKLIFDAPPGRTEWPIARFPELASLLSHYRNCQIINDVCVYLRND